VAEAFAGDISLWPAEDHKTATRWPTSARSSPCPSGDSRAAHHLRAAAQDQGDEDKVAVKLNEIIDSDVAIKVTHDAQSKAI